MIKHYTGNWFINDFENQNHEWYGSLASPHCPDNYIVATGWCIDNSPVQALYFNNDEEARTSIWIDQLKGCKWYVAHNASFEIQWMLRTYPKQFLEFINSGGRVFCTQYAEYLLSHQLEMYPTLEDTTMRYGGSPKIDAVKLLWEQGVLTADIDKALLMQYLAADGSNEFSDPTNPKFHGDVANTRRACFAQVAKLQEQGMMSMFKERMDSLLFCAMATYYGLYVDQEVASKNQLDQELQIEDLKTQLLSMLPKDLPDDFDFSFTSDYHRSAFLFGGTVKYRGKVSYDPIKYEQVEAYEAIRPDGSVIYLHPLAEWSPDDIDNDERLGNLTVTRYKSGKNKGQPKVFKIDSNIEKLKWGDKEAKFDGLIKFDDLPAIVADAYTGKRAEFKGKRELVDGTPIYSTGKDSLDVLAAHTEVAKPLKLLAALIKDTTTYYLSVDDNGKQSGMLQFVEPTGLIHHQLNSCATITGRLSGSKP